jgi:hypothetical protein
MFLVLEKVVEVESGGHKVFEVFIWLVTPRCLN